MPTPTQDNGGGGTEDLHVQLERLQKALESQRAHSSQAIQQRSQDLSFLRNQLERTQVDPAVLSAPLDSSDWFNQFSQPEKKEPARMSDPAKEPPATLTASELRKMLREEIQAVEKQKAEQFQKYQETLMAQQKQFLETDHAKDPSKVRIIEEVYQQLDHIRDPQKRYELALEKGLRLHQVTQQEIEAAKRPQSNIMNAFSQQGMMQHPSYTLPQANAPKSPFDVRPVEERFADAKQLAQDRRKAYFSQGVVSQRNPGV